MNKALLIIDAQNIYFSGKMKVTYPKDSLDNILIVMDEAKKIGLPIVIIQHSSSTMAGFKKGSHEWDLHPEVAKRGSDVVFEKTLPGSFTGTRLELWLKTNEIKTIVIAGYMTQMCCDTTARQAVHLGFNVEFLSDATGTLDVSNNAGAVTAEELHKAILVTQAMRFSKVMTTKEWISEQ
ncbi:MAG TPA: cysteine hydrolase family protein [Candidatus Omnitrophota bacterium]|nr:cysteine hydrolase family protein [Candidatus Omnitrophota bacterium]HPS19708.1 cysteine hydrolase family protein [Candidatus Omnitrophota bacterium]